MVRVSKVGLWGVVVLASAGIGLAYAGMAEPYVSQSQLPGNPGLALVAVVVLFLGGAVVSGFLDRWAWKRTGRRAGLSPAGFQLLKNPPNGNRELVGNPDLVGTARGRSVTARTYNTGSNREGSSSRKTHTVVETELETPVDWTATFVPGGDGAAAEIPDFGSTEARAVDDEFAVWGEVPDDVAEEVLSGPVRTALLDLESNVSVGNMGSHLLGSMREAVAGESGMAASLAQGMLDAGSVDEPEGNTRVEHREEGILLDAEELEHRMEAVAAVAKSVERVEAAAGA